MLQPHTSLSDVLKKLQDEQLNVEARNGYLIVYNVPYINSKKEILSGVLAMSLNAGGDLLLPPSDHTAYWTGEIPFNSDETKVPSLVNSPRKQDLGGGLITDFFLSCKPNSNGGKYAGYYEKVMQYWHTISDPAFCMDRESADRCRQPILIEDDESPLVYADTNASRANIVGINEKVKGQKVAIIGLGGTGGYVLDHVSKMPVDEIHLYDDDEFVTHNAFRAPGAAKKEELEKRLKKVDYFKEKYSLMHKGIVAHAVKIGPENFGDLDKMDFLFICVDNPTVRNMISCYCTDNNIAFVDSGLGIDFERDKLGGQCRVTMGFPEHYNLLKDSFSGEANDNDPYASNIQISELNCLAAVFMVIRWKKYFGLYVADNPLEGVESIYIIDSDTIVHR